jgi:hypothetical protein
MSNVSSSVRARYEPLRSVLFSGISGTYVGVGVPFESPARIIKVTNFTNKNILVSLNGIEDHDIVAANGFFLYDYCSNKSSAGGLLEQPQGDRMYIKAEAADNLPTIGTVYITVVYASQV